MDAYTLRLSFRGDALLANDLRARLEAVVRCSEAQDVRFELARNWLDACEWSPADMQHLRAANQELAYGPLEDEW